MRIVCFGVILKGCSHSFHACKHGGRLPFLVNDLAGSNTFGGAPARLVPRIGLDFD